MDSRLIFLPVLVQVVLTLSMFIALSMVKSRAAKSGLVNEARRGLYDDAWPESVIKVNNNIRNQFEAPVLFYVLVMALFQLGAVDMAAHICAWLFVASRIVHAYIHTGSNYVPLRRRVFTIGCVVLMLLTCMALWAVLAH